MIKLRGYSVTWVKILGH